jgi:carboxylesterase type B
MVQLEENSTKTDPLDVMFWIHGGGWFTGSGNSDMYGPQYLLDKNVILVTINYRLGPLGKFQTVYVRSHEWVKTGQRKNEIRPTNYIYE